jgi:hypothetical protein
MFPNKGEKNFKRKLLKNAFRDTWYLTTATQYTAYRVPLKYKRANIMTLMVTLPFGQWVDNHNLVHLLAVNALWCPPLSVPAALRCPPLRVRPALWCPPLGGAVRRVRPNRLDLVPQAAFLLQEGGGEGGLLRCDGFPAFLTAAAAAQPGVHFILLLSISAKQWLRIHEILMRIRIRGSIPLTNDGSGSCSFRQ